MEIIKKIEVKDKSVYLWRKNLLKGVIVVYMEI